jgi:hypothetical protein
MTDEIHAIKLRFLRCGSAVGGAGLTWGEFDRATQGHGAL